MEPREARRPRRYLRSRITRKLILDTALSVFLANGYAKTTITKISEQANVGYGTVYSHFTGKDDILIKVVDNTLEDFFRLLENPSQPSSYQEAHSFFQQAIEKSLYLAEQHSSIMKVFQEALRESQDIADHWRKIKEHFIASLNETIIYARGIGLAKDIDTVMAAKACILLIERFLWEVVQGNEEEILFLSAFLTDLIFEGIFIRNIA